MKKRIVSIVAACVLAISATAAPLRVACVGNSITYGAGVDNREVNSYPAVLGRLLGGEYEVENFGRSGATLLSEGHNPYVKTDEYARALAFKADIVVIHLGINDTDPRNWPNYRSEFVPDYKALIESFRAANPEARMIICRMTPIAHRHPRFHSGTREWHDQIQQAIELVAATTPRVELADLHAPLYNRPELLPDAVHPNAQGAQIIARTIYSAITGNYGGLAVGPLFGDGMVLQRGAASRLSGVANARERVHITLSRKGGAHAVADTTVTTPASGRWEVALPLVDTASALTLTVSTPDKVLRFSDVAIGQVWILAGQSNMSWSAGQDATPAKAAPNENIRLFLCTPTFELQGRLDDEALRKLNELDYIRSAGWSEATASAVSGFSAVGYYFGQKLEEQLGGETIGLVQISLGGGTAESFVSRQLLENTRDVADILNTPRTNDMVQDWCRKVISQNLEGTANPLQRHFFEPAYMYESRMEPLGSSLSARGVLWYQGESNAHNVELHERLFPLVVASFREAWNDEELPFYFVQLSSLNRPSWPHFRDSQRRLAEAIDNCEMVVSSDYGDSTDVHPRMKQPIGERLAAVALARNYGFKDMVYRSPRVLNSARNGRVVTLNFDRALTSGDAAPLTFEVAGADMVYRPAASVKFQGRSAIITSAPEVERAVAVRYGWQPFTRANVRSAGADSLPLSTFEVALDKK